MVGVIEWEQDNKPTGKFSPYIKIGRDPMKMFLENGKPIEFGSYSEAKKAGVEFQKSIKVN